ncbi:MAG TPA: biotin/lipoyl-binding carrier protein [Ramlibacter sp.]|uniref:biotin/lipoyl-binding carrier protein n=1 Tax=Ramlibacter sp. TaxID=1917967 RepID=UPI002BC8565A|nr:biotin/lipoyl-binding carrier protein [Ramlibacter sp.]HVZ46807.1 biotin/lipoyl-binding carrier protein [Ramlibacter sp.]
MARQDLKSEVTGKVWKILLPAGSRAAEGDVVLVVESMKMEIPVMAERDGTVDEVLVAEGDSVQDGQVVAVMRS